MAIKSHTSESDISEDIIEDKHEKHFSYTDLMDRSPNKLMRMEVNLASERR